MLISKTIVVPADPTKTVSSLLTLLSNSINRSWLSAARVSSSALTDCTLGLANVFFLFWFF